MATSQESWGTFILAWELFLGTFPENCLLYPHLLLCFLYFISLNLFSSFYSFTVCLPHWNVTSTKTK